MRALSILATTEPPPAVLPESGTRTLEELLPPYRVILHNDDVNDMHHVVHALLSSVPELSTERAAEIMMEAHTNGQAEVIRCPLERAELYRDRLESFGLTATIERA
jgi:ATP-dependent Clp protease adaptor protein ClpS